MITFFNTRPGKTLNVSATGSATYTTLAAAKAAAVAGDTIVVYPGDYAPTASLAKDRVNWDFAAGATVTLSTGNGGIFDDGGAAMSFDVTGNGVFTRSGSGSNRAIVNTTAASEINIACKRVISNQIALRAQAGTQRLFADYISSVDGTFDGTQAGCTFHVRAREIASQGYVVEGDGGTFNVVADLITTTGDTAIAVTGNGDGSIYVRARRIQSVGQCVEVLTGVTMPVVIEDAELVSTNLQASHSGVVLAGDSLTLRRCKLSVTDNAQNKPVIHVIGSGLVLDACVLVADPNADSIFASSAQPVKIYGPCFTNKAKHANVTIQVGTLTVDANVA